LGKRGGMGNILRNLKGKLPPGMAF
jgi:hypothetical protein